MPIFKSSNSSFNSMPGSALKFLLTFFIIISALANVTSKEELIGKVESQLSELPEDTNVGIIIYDPLLEDTIFSLNKMQSMVPASNTKLFTTAAALKLLGDEFQIATRIFADDIPADSILTGNLYLKGYGNPYFTEEELDSLINELVKEGIKIITGNIVGDDTYFDNIYKRDDWITNEVSNVKLPPVSALCINRNQKIVLKKRRGRTRKYRVNIENPPLYSAKLLKEKLSEHGISVTGKAVSGFTPRDASLLIESLLPLSRFINSVNKNSDNFAAECLFKIIGAETSGMQGNSFYATQAILGFIKDNDIYSLGTEIVDGSGISRFDHVTVNAVAGLLEKMYFDLQNFDDFFHSLSIAGVDGTLEDRMTGTPAENNFRGKTGTLNGVSAVSGYLTTESGDDLIISIIFEFRRGGTKLHRKVQDEIIEELCEWQ